MKKKILLVNPRIPATTFWNLESSLAMMRKKFMVPPLGLLTVASLIPREPYELKLVDLNTTPLSGRDVEGADLVFVSAMLAQKDSFEQVVRMCNASGKPVVAGGPYPSAFHSAIAADGALRIDHLVLDEAEVTLPLFLKDYEGGSAQRVYRSDEKPDLDRTPLPRWDLVDVGQYEILSAQFSRGCPHGCEFCDIGALFGRKVRTKSSEQFIRELEGAYATGFRGPFLVVDDNFIGKRNDARAALRAIAEWQRARRYPFSLIGQASLDLAGDAELLRAMVQAGFRQLFIGIESPAAETLKAIGKRQNLNGDIAGSLEKIQSVGIEVLGGFVVGFDTDAEDVFDAHIALINQARIPVALVEILAVLPNTQLHARMARENRLISQRNGNNAHEMKVNFKPRMPAEALVGGARRVLSEIYTPRAYFERCLDLLARFPKQVEVNGLLAMSKPHLASLLVTSFLKQGLSFYGGDYLQYMYQVVTRHREHLAHALYLAVRGDAYIRKARGLAPAAA